MPKLWPIVLLCLFPILQAPSAACQMEGRWSMPTAELARQTATLSGPGPATLSVQNASSIASDQLTPIRHLLEAALKMNGIGVRAPAEGAAIPTAIRVTLSESRTGGLWVAEVQQGAEVRVAIVPVAEGSVPKVAESFAPITLRKRLLISAREAILDAQLTGVETDPGTSLVLLTPTRIAVYRQSSGVWKQAQSSAFDPSFVLSRDPRGVIVTTADTLSVFLPGRICEGPLLPLAVSCRASDDPWPIGTRRAVFNASRNYFSGVVVPASAAALTPFYSAAELPGPGGVLVFSDIRGRIRLLDRGAQVDLTGSRDWGSELAEVHSGCGFGTQLVTDGAGDSAADSLRAYEVSGREASAVSAPLTVDGAVIAMTTGTDQASLNVIVRRDMQRAKQYEVWRVTLDCR